jgi:hypothetical protein
MLNSSDLEELKIEALLQTVASNLPAVLCADLAPALAPGSSEHIIIRHSTNSNILSFSCVLLSHIFDSRSWVRGAGSDRKEPRGSTNKSSEKAQEPSPTARTMEEQEEARLRLHRIYSFLFN